MRGVILAGGKGTRLERLTKVTNKHLVPVGELPMIEYPLNTIKQIGIDTINVVTGGENFEDIAKYLGIVHPKVHFSIHYQPEPSGIAHALSFTEYFVGKEKLAVILGDNIFEENFYEAAKKFEESDYGAMLFLKKVSTDNAKHFGCANIDKEKIISIEEKPKKPTSNLAVTGLYFYDLSVFDKIKKLKPSARGELEITDVNNMYIKEGKCDYEIVNGFWSDAGTHESRKRATDYVDEVGLRKFLI